MSTTASVAAAVYTHPATLARVMDPSGFSAPEHVNLIARRFAHVATHGGRLIVEAPPRHSKSESVSRRGPLWYLNQWPSRSVILTSYAAELAVGNGRWIRNTLRANPRGLLSVQLTEDSTAANRWNTGAGGGLLATGVGGSMTGFGGHLIVIDDPLKNWQEAMSKRQREHVWDWYRSVVRTRLMRNGSIVLALTRWHEDDPAGRLIEHDPHGWEVLRLPAFSEGADTDPLDRPEGQVLWPEMYDEEWMQSLATDLGPYLTAALLQQRPSPPEGQHFKDALWGMVDEIPADAKMVRRWDLAATEGGGDFTASVLLARHDGKTYVVDVIREQLRAGDVKALARLTCAEDLRRWGRKVKHVVEQEPGSAGKAVAEEWVADVFAGYNAEASPTRGNKEQTTLPLAAQQQAGNVFLLRRWKNDEDGYVAADWWAEFRKEAIDFPHGAHDDAVDAAGKAFLDLTKAARQKKGRTVRTRGRTVTPPGAPR